MIPRTVRRTVRFALAGAALALVSTAQPARGQAAPTASGGTIEGIVRDAGTQQPLSSAQVFVVGTGIGVSTGAAGTFRLINVPVGTVEVRVRLIGYAQSTRSVPVALGATARVEFELQQSALQLEAVVTTGTGTAVETKKLGNTVGSVDLAELRSAPIQSPTEALAARVPGVSVLPSSGMTGAGGRIRIRGNASLSQSNNPIIYIDGIRMDNGGSGAGAGDRTSRLDDIDPTSIERIEVLKGAAAATLYGTEASNGVIQIFTKKGSQGEARWSFDYERSSIAYPDRVAPNAGFATTQTQADLLSKLYSQTITPFVPFSYNVTKQLFETGYGNVFSGAVTGGTDRMTYYVGARHQFEDGPFTSSKLGGGEQTDVARRDQATLNLNIFPREKINIGFQSRYSLLHNELVSGGNNIYSPYSQAMYARPDQGYCLDDNGVKSLDAIAGNGRCKRMGNPFGNTLSTTVREALQQEIFQDGTHYTGAVTARYAPSAEFSLDATLGLDNTSMRGVSFLPFGNAVDRFSINAPDGSRSVDDLWQRNYTMDVKSSWDRRFGSAIQSTLVVGGQGFITDQRNEGGSNRNFPGPGLEVVGAGNTPSVYEGLVKVVNAGYFVQEQVGLNDWIFGTVGARYDYNSAFGESAGGVLYPKASISIVPSDRQSWTWGALSTLRLRAAVGRSGRQPGAFDKFTTYRPLAASTGGGLMPDNLGNPDLKPEVSTEIEAGAEAGFLNDRVSLTLTNWQRKVTDALVQKQFPLSGGFTARQLANIGELKASGWELGVTGYVVNKPNLSIDLFANGSYLHQNVVSLGGAPPIKIQGSYVRIRGFIREGYAPGALFGAKIMAPCTSYSNPAAQAMGGCLKPGETPFTLGTTGRPATEAELLAALANPINPTNLRLLRADDDGNGDFLDHYQGKPMPDWQGAFGGSVRVAKRWKLSTLFEYKTGNFTVTNLTDAFRNSSPSLGRNKMEASKVTATLLNPASTAQERYDAAQKWLGLVALSPYDGVNQNDRGDFVRWRELSLSFTAPNSLASRIGASEMSLMFAARNLLLWTRYPGTDPEINVAGVSNSLSSNQIDNNFYDSSDTFALPIPRRFTLTLRLGF